MKGGRVWHILDKVRQWLCPELILVIRSWWPWGKHIHLENDGDRDEGATDGYARMIGRHRANICSNVSSSDVRGFVTMLFHLVEYIGHLENWFRTCPCHSTELLEAVFPKQWSCILSGCRAVCCASGEFDLVLKEITTASEHTLSAKLPTDMSEAARSDVIRQFNLSKNIIFTNAVLRFKEWKVLPLSLFGIGHHDTDRALTYLARCFIQFHTAIADNKRASLHDSVIEMFEADLGRTEVLTALRTGEIMDTGYLAEWRAKWQFARCCEVSVERLHATINAGIRKANAAGYGLLFHLFRRLEFNELCEDSIARAAVISHLDFTYSGATCIASLGMSGHADAVAYLLEGNKCVAHFPNSTAARIIYRGDTYSQFGDFTIDWKNDVDRSH